MERRERLTFWLGRIVLAIFTLLFTLIGLRFISNPVGAAAESGITLAAPLGVTIARVGFGAFPLGCAINAAFCLASARRLFTGVAFVSLMVGVVFVVRVIGILVDHTAHESLRVLGAEVVLLALSAVSLFAELGKRRYRRAQAA
ncbi:MAG TPA: hypothetical protein VE713_08120 [Pyrinomonadaceae bacterium]|nr:hypothetical protein [Pyrinomonadaceae bacterium]